MGRLKGADSRRRARAGYYYDLLVLRSLRRKVLVGETVRPAGQEIGHCGRKAGYISRMNRLDGATK